MAHNSESSNVNASDPVGRVQDLSWALFDEHISANEMTELESLLMSDTDARNVYIECAQLHVDLAAFYAEPQTSKKGSSSKTQVLGFLGEAMPTPGMPTADKS